MRSLVLSWRLLLPHPLSTSRDPGFLKGTTNRRRKAMRADFTLSNPPSPKKFPFNCRLRSCTQGGDLKPPHQVMTAIADHI
ncbi:unnamed protein product [Spirodela intermedia]|uniref:Uncharacterized protein n=1 Tax=Spirodela intermedia TaxID=51605 RepID=A0A7I8JVW0_SPIIN|nr:unnamed protein product [Spirodela intermedia]